MTPTNTRYPSAPTKTKHAIMMPDLLVEILAHVFNAPLNRDCREIPLQFIAARVSRRWRDIIFGTSSLWVNVYLSPLSTFNVERYLHRSNDALIKLVIAFPDSASPARFLENVRLHLPPHSERIWQLSINLCDCHTPLVFDTIDILSHLSMKNLVTFEILEIHDPTCYFCKRGVTRAIPKAGLPWGQNLQRVCVPGSWLHVVINGPRPELTTLEIDNGMLSKKSFRAMVENMPVLTNLILHDQNNVYQELVDTSDDSSPITITIPSLRLLRVHDYGHPPPNSEGKCHCLLKPLIAPHLEVLEICSEYRREINPDDPFDWDTLLYEDSRTAPDVFPITCVYDQNSLRHWNRPSSRLRKIRIENVPAPHRIIHLLEKPVDIEYVYNHSCHSPVDLMLLPLEIPIIARSLTFDLVAADMENNQGSGDVEPNLNVIPVLQEIIALAENPNTCLHTCPVTIHLPPNKYTPGADNKPFPEQFTIVYTPTSADSHPFQTQDELGYFSRRNYWMNRGCDYAFRRSYSHAFCQRPRQSLTESMEVPFNEELIDSDDDSIWAAPL